MREGISELLRLWHEVCHEKVADNPRRSRNQTEQDGMASQGIKQGRTRDQIEVRRYDWACLERFSPSPQPNAHRGAMGTAPTDELLRAHQALRRAEVRPSVAERFSLSFLDHLRLRSISFTLCGSARLRAAEETRCTSSSTDQPTGWGG